jgi:hypothetical protein
MSIEFLENDLGSILNSSIFDEPALFQPSQGEEFYPCRVIFNGAAREESPGQARASALSMEYSVTIKETDLPIRPARDDFFIFSQVNGSEASRPLKWKVFKVISDGHGMLTISLHKVS